MSSALPSSFGELLQTFRKQKKIRQQVLADKLGVHRNTIGAWERGDRLPDTKGIVLELAKQLGLNGDETRQLLEASLTALSSYWHVPYPRNPFFTGRHAFLETLHHRLGSEQSVALSQSYALSGLGGIGKTQLALEYVYQHALDYSAIFWVAAETIETLYSSFAMIASKLQLPEREEKEAEKIVQAVLRWLDTHKEWLLVFDNLEDLSLLQPFSPSARQGAMLITTRLRSLEGLSYTFELPPLPDDEGVQFLLHRTKLADPIVSSDPLSPELAEPALAIVKALGGLPLALDQAGAYIERTGCSLKEYLHLFQHHQISLLAERSELAHHPASVVKTFLLSFERIVQANEAAADLLRLCAFLAPDAIPEELFTKGASSLGAPLETIITDSYQFNQTLGEALRYSLLGRQPQNHTLSIHRLVQAVLQDTLSETERRTWAERAVQAVNAAFPEVEHDTWELCERLLPHVLVCEARIELEQTSPPEVSRVLDKAGTYLRERGQYSEAEPLLVRALAIREQHLGLEHPDTATCQNKLANLYRLQGKYERAESLYQHALSIREQQLGTEHPDTATSLNNLAILYWQQSKYEMAETLYQRALAIREQHLGAEHPHTAASLNNLAILYWQQGKYERAEPLYQRALSIYEQHLGVEHPSIANSLNNLANLYWQQGKYEMAEPLYQRALSIYEQHLGAEHSDTARSLNNLAQLYTQQGKYEMAEPLYQRALSIYEKHLGPQHPDTAMSLHNLAQLYEHLGKYELAEPLYQRALSIYEKHLGTNHPLTAHPLHGLAALSQYQGKHEQAEALYQRVLTIREQRLGPTHPETQETRKDYAAFLRLVGRDAEATALDRSDKPSTEEGH